MNNGSQDQLAHEIEQVLREQHGEVLGGAALYRTLGFRTSAAMRQAKARGKLPVPVFPIAHRRGRFALTHEVARWLASCRMNSFCQAENAEPARA